MSARSHCVTCGNRRPRARSGARRSCAGPRASAGARPLPQRVKSGSGTARAAAPPLRRAGDQPLRVRLHVLDRDPSASARCRRLRSIVDAELARHAADRRRAGAGGVSGARRGFRRRSRAAVDVDDVLRPLRVLACGRPSRRRAVVVRARRPADRRSDPSRRPCPGRSDSILAPRRRAAMSGSVVSVRRPLAALGLRRAPLRAGIVGLGRRACLSAFAAAGFSRPPRRSVGLSGFLRRRAPAPSSTAEDRLADLDLVAGLDLDLFHRARRPTKALRSSPCRFRARRPPDLSRWCRPA